MRFQKLLIALIFITSTAIAQKQMPSLSIKGEDNKTYHLKNDFKDTDKIYVFSFWATWCGPCLNELDAIKENYAKWQTELNMEVIAVSIDDTRTQKRVKPLLNGKSWPFKVLLDTNQDVKRALSIVNVPYTIVVKNQKIVYIHNGYSQGAEHELFKKLKQL